VMIRDIDFKNFAYPPDKLRWMPFVTARVGTGSHTVASVT